MKGQEFEDLKTLLETNLLYLRIDIGEVKTQLEKLNGRTRETEIQCAQNQSDTMSNRRLIWGILIGIVVTGIVAGILGHFGIII
jgi:hypothetical protein